MKQRKGTAALSIKCKTLSLAVVSKMIFRLYLELSYSNLKTLLYQRVGKIIFLDENSLSKTIKQAPVYRSSGRFRSGEKAPRRVPQLPSKPY